MGILIGTDFNDGVRGIGPKKSLAFIKKYGRLEDIPKDGKLPIPEEYQEVRKVFLEPEITDEYTLRWGKVDPEAVRRILCDKHAFGVDRIDSVLVRISAKSEVRKQKSLDSWST
jgi:flap endonuclease-1